jgi:hypothetical protein
VVRAGFMEVLAVWLRENVDPKAAIAYTLAEGTKETGGCHTCYETIKVVWITYADETGKMYNIARATNYATLIKDLEKIAYTEDRREARALLLRDLTAAIIALPGRTDMVYEVLAEFLRFPGRDGVECVVHRGSIVEYLPAVSIPWLIKDGLVKPMCTNATESCVCEWCRLAALTDEDREWLAFYGWHNPFEVKK